MKPAFRVGDAVVVKPGVMDPERPDISLAGWQGRVTEVYPQDGNVEFKWDSISLRAMPPDYIRHCELEGLDWSTMILGADEVEPATPRDKASDAEEAYEEIMARHSWDYLSDENPGIAEVLADIDTDDMAACLDAWEEHLTQVLRFPFKSLVKELETPGPVEVGDEVEVLGVADVDDLYGILVNVRMGRRRYVLALCDLEATDANSSNYQPLRDYVVWYANR